MTARHAIGPVSIEVTESPSGLIVRLERGATVLVDQVGGMSPTLPLAKRIRLWARACVADLGGAVWSHWGRRAGRWTLLAEQMPTCATWHAAYRVGAETIVVAHGRVEPIESVRNLHGERVVSEAVMRARTAAELGALKWIDEARRGLCASLGEASQSGVAA